MKTKYMDLQEHGTWKSFKKNHLPYFTNTPISEQVNQKSFFF